MTAITSNLGWMSREEQKQVREHPELEWIFGDCAGLAGLRTLAPPAPRAAALLDLAFDRAARKNGTAVTGAATNQWRGWAIGATALIILLAALFILLPVADRRTQSAWAMVDGFILEYEMKFDEEYTASAAAAPEHPLNALIIAVHEWDKAHRDELGGENGPRASVDILDVQPVAPNPGRASFKILLPGATTELRDDLVNTLATFDGLSEPVVFSQRWYYQEKYPELFIEHRQVVIDGKSYRFPEDFSNNEIDTLLMYLRTCAMGSDKMYVAFPLAGLPNRFDLGDVVSIETNAAGEIEINTYAGTLELAPDEIPIHPKSWCVFSPPKGTDMQFDPIKLLKRQADPDWQNLMQLHTVNEVRAGSVLVVDLLPVERWLGLPPEEMKAAFSKCEQTQAQQSFERIQSLVEEWGKQLPKDAYGKRPECVVQPMGPDGLAAQAWIVVWYRFGLDLRGFVKELEQQISVVSGTTPDRFIAQDRSQDVSSRINSTFMFKDYYKLHYDLLPADTTDLFEDEITALWSGEEQQQARETAERLETAFNNWLAKHPELKEQRKFSPSPPFSAYPADSPARTHAYTHTYEQAGVLRSFTVFLYKRDPDLAAELQEALALPGVPEPEVTDPDKPGYVYKSPQFPQFQNSNGYRLEWRMFSDERLSQCAGVNCETASFTQAERDHARSVLGAIRDGWRQWLDDHPAVAALQCMGISVNLAQVQHQDGVPTELSITLGVDNEELLADLLAELAVPGASEPEVTNLREQWEELARAQSSLTRQGSRRELVDMYTLDGYRLVYYFFPRADTMYLTPEQALEQYSTEELDHAYELALELDKAFHAWADSQVMLYDEAQLMIQMLASHPHFVESGGLSNNRRDQIVIGAYVELQREDEAWYEDLKAALADFPVEPSADSGKTHMVRVIRKMD
ncbi:hypothetical protein JW859_15145 [bacterium]|nr:hypothetical protein [bacterium]